MLRGLKGISDGMFVKVADCRLLDRGHLHRLGDHLLLNFDLMYLHYFSKAFCFAIPFLLLVPFVDVQC